jgi:hypothetical protein
MKKVLSIILLIIMMSGFLRAASGLTLDELRRQERRLALADFKMMYKQRQSINKQLLQRATYNRTKMLQHNTLFTHAGKQVQSMKGQSGTMNNAGAFQGSAAKGTSPDGNTMSETMSHGAQNNLWGKRP